ncbi:D-xylose transporter XylE [Thalassotalea hakodatensis]|uniref:D-xylose transporter XylE n=1 Tax=Thalassotalea hakodatensis TaxID=3030492 RepID=UPI00257385F3|nr:D-xylose transporter XylE [Thalassotalea hakodatensis]
MTNQQDNQSSGYITLLTLVAALGGMLFGWDTAVISGTVSSLDAFFIAPLGLAEYEANSLLGTLVSSALIGCVIGGAIAGVLSQKYGRKKMLIVSAALFFISALGSAIPEMGFYAIGSSEANQALPQFIFYRILGGVGVGMASMLSPLYIAEIAPAKIRGRLVSFNQMAIVTGIIVVYFVNYLIALQGGESWIQTLGWRYMFASEMLPAALFFFLLFTVPESPRWHAINGHDKEARNTLAKLHGPKEAELEFSEIKESLSHHTSGKLFSFGLMVLVVGILLSMFQQLIGINAVLYYAPEIFKNMGSGTNAAMLQTIIVGAFNVIFTLVAIFTVDKFGRKPLMIIGALGMCVAMTALGFSFYTESMGISVLIAMLAYVAFFSLSWGPVCWVLLSEIFPNKIRSLAMSVAVAAQWITNYLVSWSFPLMNNNTYLTEQFNHGFAYWIYGGMSLLAALFVWKFVPETKGKSLEEMEKLWDNDTSSENVVAKKSLA